VAYLLSPRKDECSEKTIWYDVVLNILIYLNFSKEFEIYNISFVSRQFSCPSTL
jgi:hypothetical protein